MITVLIADDHPAFRRGIALMVGDLVGVELVGSAQDGEQAVLLAQQLRPSVVLMDIKMPGLDGIEATRRIAQMSPAPAVLILTMFEDDDSVFAAMRAGARGYLLKGAEEDAIEAAIRAAAVGDAVFGAEIADRVIGHFASGATAAESALPMLSAREREVLQLMTLGKTNAAIAHELMISLKTVRNHVSNILTKLRVPDRVAAITRARASREPTASGGRDDGPL
ncbi:response regulator [Leucobacter sp. HY1908]